jgi:quinoprotein glucose dehydrogenase
MQRYWTLIILGGTLAMTLAAQTNKTATKPAPASDWPMYNRDLAGTRYSPLTQINTKNVAALKQAWSFQLKADPKTPAAPWSVVLAGRRQ